MNPHTSLHSCKHLSEAISSLRNGQPASRLSHHFDACPACSHARHLATILQQDAATLRSLATLPTAVELWQAAQHRAHHRALVHSNRIFVLMASLSAIYALSLAAWVVRHIGPVEYLRLLPTVSAWVSSSTLAAATLAGLSTILGCCYLFRHDKPVY